MSGRLVPAAALAAAAALVLSACEPTNQGYEPRQPVAYSHAVHAGGMEIPCLYCHYAAERGRYAGIPPASVCMNCHAQIQPQSAEVLEVVNALQQQEPIRWVRVHKLPDHAFFDHSAHVGAGQVQCQTCHGQIQSMGIVRQDAPLTMGWCLSCHRQQEAAPTTTTAAAGVARGALTDCVTCHH